MKQLLRNLDGLLLQARQMLSTLEYRGSESALCAAAGVGHLIRALEYGLARVKGEESEYEMILSETVRELADNERKYREEAKVLRAEIIRRDKEKASVLKSLDESETRKKAAAAKARKDAAAKKKAADAADTPPKTRRQGGNTASDGRGKTTK